ncbi:hypothetical protein niasHT_012740 [Heterodera trifolii]|uniref:G protein-coupled receptor n=1 Tax=Heterodera trifolii TaxID=157864 RepID=A0ABD2L7P4_9BILA
MPNFEAFLLFLGGAVELGINLFGIPLSLTNLCLVARTSVIHPNMKAILIFQSLTILTRGICRFIICLFKFILWDPIGAEKMRFFPAIANLYFVGVYSRNVVPHILIVERILATVFVRSYEHWRGYLFTIIWSPIALTVCIYIAFTTSPQSARPLANLITTAVEVLAGSVELAIFMKLCRYNLKIYQKMMQNEGQHSLSLRYQLSENIRIGKQLIPPLSLNLCAIIISAISITWSYFGLPFYYHLFILLANLSSAIGFLIELLIITCHPFLKRDIVQIWRNVIAIFSHCSRRFLPEHRRIADLQTATAAVFENAAFQLQTAASAEVGIAQRDLISGKALIDRSKPDDHFAMLRQAWERRPADKLTKIL